MKRPSALLGICLLIIVASLTAQAQGRNSPPLVVHFSGTDTFTFFDDCTGEAIAGDIAFAGVLTQTITNPGGPLEQNHFDVHVTTIGTAIGQTTGIQYVDNETIHDSQAGTATFPFSETFTENVRIVSKGPSSNLAFSETFHITITATGETAVMLDNVKTYCQ